MKKIGLLAFGLASAFAQSTGATFEVATVKSSPPPDGRGFIRGCKGGPGTDDPGLWRCTNATILMLVMRGYDVKHYQVTSPDWMANANYEISAKLPPNATKDQLQEMIRNLLAERFKLELHRSQKEMAIYDLVIDKGGPKLKESMDKPASDSREGSSGSSRSERGPEADADGYPIIPKDCSGCMMINAAGKARYYASKESVKNFAEMIGNQLGKPVNDTTGLSGKYDIVLSWSRGGGVTRRGPDSRGADTDADSDPGVTIEAAVQQQLGLKLEPKKGMIETIIVDKAEKNPAEN